MKHKTNLFIFSLTLMLSLGIFEQVLACSCGTRSSCEAFGDSKAVFIGEVIEGSSPERMSDMIGLKTNDLKFTLSVQESFRGAESSKQIEIYTGLGFGDCGFPFEKGKSYLVYAYEREGKLYTSICSRSRHISRVESEEFKFLETVSKKPWKGARIFGNVSAITQRKEIDFNTKETKESLYGIKLELKKGSESKQLNSDAQGNYEVEGLEAGKYDLKLLLPKEYTFDKSTYVLYSTNQNWETRNIEVKIGGCQQEDFALINDSVLSGKITGSNGESLEKATVQLIPINSPDKLDLEEVYDAETNNIGEFNVKTVLVGKYYLGINLAKSPDEQQPYQKTFYPGTTDRNQAKIIEVKAGQKVSSLNFQLTKKLVPLYVSGIVTFVDGKPAADVSITLEDSNRPNVCVNGCNIRTDSQGKFKLKGYKDYTYFVSAYDSSKEYDKFEQKTISTPITFKLEKNYDELKVMLEITPKKSKY